MSPAQEILDRANLERAEQDLHRLAFELRRVAPTIATRAGALARECELRLAASNRSSHAVP